MDLPEATWSVSSSSRDHLVNFWLHAPVDQLEELWKLPFGQVTRDLVKQLTPDFAFTSDQILLRNEIGQRFEQIGLSEPLSHQLMLANFLLSPPGLLQINNVESFFPLWLAAAYSQLYESPSSNDAIELNSLPTSTEIPSVPSPPDFGPFPTSLEDLVSSRIHLNRLLGLSNLYYIDPDDKEILGELQAIRTSLALAIDVAPESDLERLWGTDLGDRYWSLVRSGVQSEFLNDVDTSIKNKMVNRLNPDMQGGFGTPGSINAFLIAMMYFMPGTISVPDAQTKIPHWLFSHYAQIFDSSS